MSYTNTTTHFQWPLPEETDLFNGLDDNQMKEDLDEKIYNLEQRSTGDHETVAQLNERVTEVEQTVGGYDEQIEALEGTVGEHAERLINLTNRQTELSRRLNGKAGESTIAAEYNEEESYSVGDFVYYANILYKCTTASATPAGAFDSDDWDVAILTNELGGSTPGAIAAANVSFDDAVAQLGASNVQTALVALKTLVDNIGGGGMKFVDVANKVSLLGTSTPVTLAKDSLLVVSVLSNTTGDVLVDGESVFSNNTATGGTYTSGCLQIPLKAGQVINCTITSSGATDKAHIVWYAPYFD